MISVKRKVLGKFAVYVCGAFFLYTPSLYSQPNNEMEAEIRCCFRSEEVKNQFIITISKNYTKGQIHLYIESPSGDKTGFDVETNLFYKPTSNMVYAAALPYVGDITDPEEYKRRTYAIRLTELEAGIYTLKVIGVVDSDYYLVFRPGGPGDSAAVQHFGTSSPIKIKKDELHVYKFNGEFADIHDGSIFPDDPRRFRAERIK